MAGPRWKACARRQPCPAPWVPATQFVALSETGRVLGMIQVRHRFNAYLERYGGHIGYSVRPSAAARAWPRRCSARP